MSRKLTYAPKGSSFCTKCKTIKKLNKFYPSIKNVTRGVYSSCKQCVIEAYYKKRGGYHRANRVWSTRKGYKICADCNKQRLFKNFFNDAIGKFGIKNDCKRCTKAIKKKGREMLVDSYIKSLLVTRFSKLTKTKVKRSSIPPTLILIQRERIKLKQFLNLPSCFNFK